jgi:serine/threonine-protein kinase
MGNNLLAVPFDLKTLKVTGGPVPLVEGVWRAIAEYAPQYAVSDSGTLVYIPGTVGAATQRTLLWVDRKGKEVQIAAAPNNYQALSISPDGTKVALSVYPSATKYDIWTLDLARSTMTRLTFNEASDTPLWTHDGKRIVFTLGSANKWAVNWKAADGTGKEDQLIPEQDQLGYNPSSWSKDGKTLLLSDFHQSGISAIGALSMESDRKVRMLLKEKYAQFYPQISPDGRWMAYQSNESGKDEVYVRPFPEVNNGKWQVSTSGGNTPLWLPNGRELFYLSGDSVMAVSVETDPAFKAAKPETLFKGTYVQLSTSSGQPWDISPDGKRFLMMKDAGSTSSETGGPRKINIVLNWFEELKQRVPGK